MRLPLALAALALAGCAATAEQRAHQTLLVTQEGVGALWSTVRATVTPRCERLAQSCYSDGRRTELACPEVQRCTAVLTMVHGSLSALMRLVREAAIELAAGRPADAAELVLRASEAFARVKADYETAKKGIGL